MKFGEFAARRIEPAEHIRELTSVPERTVARRQRIVRAGARRRNLPSLEGHLGRSWNDHAVRLALLREILDQIGLERLDLIGLERRSLVDHHAQHRGPAARRVARAHAAEQRVADVAIGFRQFLPRPVGQ